MIDNQLLKKTKRKRRIAIITGISGVVVTVFVIVAFLSTYVGNFTINVMNYESKLALSTNSDMSDSSSFMKVDSFLNATPYSIDEINATDLDTDIGGQKNSTYKLSSTVTATRFFCVTFFISNVGSGPCYYSYGVDITDEQPDHDERLISDMLRFRIFENPYNKSDVSNETHNYIDYTKINQKTSSDTALAADTKAYLADCDTEFADGTLKYFASDSTTVILSDASTTKLYPEEVLRYTIVMWIEGNDPDCTGDYFQNSSGIRLSAYVTGTKA